MVLVDECATGVSECSHGCLDQIVGYTCLCPSGYSLGQDNQACIGW